VGSPLPLEEPSKKLTWKRVIWLEFWMCFLPPVGLWMLWRDQTLNRSAKLRMVTYTFLVPLALYLAASIYLFNATEHAIKAAGGEF
jgi:hypothetical protein